MSYIRRFFTWWMDTFRGRSTAGKLLLGAVTLCIVCFACAIPISIVAPPTTPTPADQAQTGDAVTVTATPDPTETLVPVTVETTVVQTSETATVVDIIDGDTIDVEIDGQEYRVRYIGVDTPERGRPFYDEATEANAEFVAGEQGQDFFFPNGFVLQPGQSCRVYTDENHPETCGFSYGSGRAIWNNGGECGYLFNDAGQVVSEYCY